MQWTSYAINADKRPAFLFSHLEERYQLNPNSSEDAAQDKAGDGYTNVEEYVNGTDPSQFVDYRDPANNRDPALRDRK